MNKNKLLYILNLFRVFPASLILCISTDKYAINEDIVGANAVVVKDVPPNVIVWGLLAL